MDLDDGTGTQARFEEYTVSLATVLGHADRVRPFADYCIGLLSAEGRKTALRYDWAARLNDLERFFENVAS